MHSYPLLTVVLALVALWPAEARAYKIARTANDAQLELHWDTWVVPYTIHYRGAEDVHDVLLQGALHRAFRAWGEVSDAGLQFQSTAQWADKASEPDDHNVLYWIESAWPHGTQVIGLTSINYYPDTGEIVDVDIAFNGMDYDWTVFDEAVETDIQSIATHEIGHMFGLDHSETNESVMWFQYTPGETRQRELSGDDLDAVAYLYPCSEAADQASAERLKDRAADCEQGFYETGCALAAPGRAGLWTLALLALALALVRRQPSARLPLLAVAMVHVAAGPAPAGQAHVAARLAAEQVLDASDAVVLGEVTAVDPYWGEDGHVHSRVEVRVEEWLRGSGPEHLELDRPAGELPAMGTVVPGEPRFESGQQLVLALTDAGGRWVPTALAQGFFQIVDTAAGPMALRHPGGPLLGERLGGAERIPLAELLARARR